MRLSEHMRECLEKLGKSHREVHLWLDEFFHDPRYGTKHRRKRHHEEGIRIVKEKWGDEASEAARLHIISDLKQEGFDPAKDPLPGDEKDYNRMGFW